MFFKVFNFIVFFCLLLFFKRIKDIRQRKINFWLSKLPHRIFLFTVYRQNKRTYSQIQIFRATIEWRLFHSNTAAIYRNWTTGTGTKCKKHLAKYRIRDEMRETFGKILHNLLQHSIECFATFPGVSRSPDPILSSPHSVPRSCILGFR